MQEYIEREDEFDINPREDAAAAANGDARAAAANGNMDEDAEVDIGGKDPHAAAGDPFADCVSSDEDVAGGWAEAGGKLRLLHHLPIEVQRRASPAPACACLPSSEARAASPHSIQATLCDK